MLLYSMLSLYVVVCCVYVILKVWCRQRSNTKTYEGILDIYRHGKHTVVAFNNDRFTTVGPQDKQILAILSIVYCIFWFLGWDRGLSFSGLFFRVVKMGMTPFFMLLLIHA